MRLDDLTIGQAKELAGMFQTLAPHAESESVTEQFFALGTSIARPMGPEAEQDV